MDNEELKKKIIDVLRGNIEYEANAYPDDNYTEVVIKYEALADALIAAGIGDVGEWKHRAERADRALTNTCAILYAQGVEYPYSDEEWQLQQAEKELTEGKKG